MSKHPKIVRSKISKEMSFAVGYELLREHFSTAIHWAESVFDFCPHPTDFASEFTRILRTREPYRILRLEHGAQGPPGSEPAAHRRFTIYPVPRNLRTVARAALLGQAFPALKQFLDRCPLHRNYYNRCEAIFDPIKITCTVEQLREFSFKRASNP